MITLISLLFLLEITPAERGIAQAQESLKKNANQAEGYNALAIALARRARETSDAKYYTQAEEAVKNHWNFRPGILGR